MTTGTVPPPPVQQDWDAVVEALRETPGELLLLAHVAPDADALGSALGVALALRAIGRDVGVSFGDDPFVVPRVLSFLPGQDLLRAPDQVGTPALAMSFDVSSADRLGVLEPVYRTAGVRIAVDHHASYTGFGDLALVDVAAPATAVLALELVDRLGADLTPDVASALYAGLLTDTGAFTFSATTPQTHEIAARLLGTGIAHHTIARRLYDDEPFAAVRMLGAALARAELLPDAAGGQGLVLASVSAAQRGGLPIDTVEQVIDGLRRTNEAEVAVVLKQDDTGAWRVSLRSKDVVDVGVVARSLGGGGHRFAAGFTGDGDLAAVRAALLAALADPPTAPPPLGAH